MSAYEDKDTSEVFPHYSILYLYNKWRLHCEVLAKLGDLRLKNRFPCWYFILVTSPRDLWWQIHLTLKSTFYYVTHNAMYIPVMYRCEYNSLSLTNHVINQDIFFTLLVSDPKRVGSTGRQKQGYRPQKRHSRDFSRTKFWLSNCNGERIAGALLSNQIEYFEMLYKSWHKSFGWFFVYYFCIYIMIPIKTPTIMLHLLILHW